MMSSRRAERGPDRRSALRAATLLLAGATAALSACVAVIASTAARRVVTPTRREADVRILDVDTAAQTITLSRTPDTELPGRYGLFTTGTPDYLKLGAVLTAADGTVRRKLLTHIGDRAGLDAEAAFSGWYFDRPEQLQLPFTQELIGSSVGPCPAWLFPAAADTGSWVIQIHGRGTTRAETLRAVPVFRDHGFTSLLVSYRNDGEAPRSRSGMYTLGATEWRDVEAAIAFARRHGARDIVLMGWSMGGAIALQAALSSAHRDVIRGVVLDSPVIDWSSVLRFHAGEQRVPRPVVDLAMGALGSAWATGLMRSGERIPFERLDVLARAAELTAPMLLLHSDDDGFVPADGSHALAKARPDLVTLEVFERARHTKLWNYDQDRWTTAITSWLRAHALLPAGADS